MIKHFYHVEPGQQIEIKVSIAPGGASLSSSDIDIALGVSNDPSMLASVDSAVFYGGDLVVTVSGDAVHSLEKFGHPVLDIYNKTAKKMILRVVFV